MRTLVHISQTLDLQAFCHLEQGGEVLLVHRHLSSVHELQQGLHLVVADVFEDWKVKEPVGESQDVQEAAIRDLEGGTDIDVGDLIVVDLTEEAAIPAPKFQSVVGGKVGAAIAVSVKAPAVTALAIQDNQE